MEVPTCTKDAPYRGNHSSYHPDCGPMGENAFGHVIWWCPNCGLKSNTKMSEAEVYQYLGLPLPQPL